MLERHLEGELEIDDRIELFEHMETCEECREILEAEERLIDRLASIPRIVPPSDLRASILREVERERLDTQPLDQDERFAAIFAGPDEDERFESAMASRRSRRTRWQCYSPFVATAFLIVAAIGALFTSDLSDVVPLQRMQVAVRSVVQKTGSLVARIAMQQESDGRDAPSPRPSPRFDVPAPAEQAMPAVAAIVLRPTDAVPNLGFDEHDEFGEVVAQAVSTPEIDQFVYEGHRYRCYTVNVPGIWQDSLMRALDGYRTAFDESIVSAICEQSEEVPASEDVEFFAAPWGVLCDAVLANRSVASSGQTARHRLKIFLVE